VARYHRHSPPERKHPGMDGLAVHEFQVVRKLATLLRLADSLDRSHHQPVRAMKTQAQKDLVALRLRSRSPLDLELWDAEHEASLFRRVFRKRLELTVSRG
jgi:exopolyphosphatase/guanosine-5'-triphosphate,3'-diphosphate pyrophosphatase